MRGGQSAGSKMRSTWFAPQRFKAPVRCSLSLMAVVVLCGGSAANEECDSKVCQSAAQIVALLPGHRRKRRSNGDHEHADS